MDRQTIAGQSEGDVVSSVSESMAAVQEFIKKGNLNKNDNKELLKIEKLLKEQGEYFDLLTELAKDDKESAKQLKKQLKQAHREDEATKNKNALRTQLTFEKSMERLGKSLSSLLNKINNGINSYTQYALRVNASLEGVQDATTKSQKTYSQVVDSLTDALGSTGLAKMTDVLAQMSNLADRGIVANLEQNAFLMSIKDGIASTFDAANGTLMRLIKLQGEDSTVNRLVMQASLKEYLNSTYQNSQYLYEQFDKVSDNLLEATSLLTSDLSNSLEATVQKWMGSLSSVGLSDTAINNLSAAIGAIGSGNLSGIDQNMQNLAIMAANQVGLSYSDLMLGGFTDEQVDSLMSGIVQYLGSLSGSNVVMSEYARLFGLTISDLKAMQNATSDLSDIMSTTVASNRSALGNYLAKYNQYLNDAPAQLYDTLYENMFFRFGKNVAEDKGAYQSYKIGGFISDITGSLGLTGAIGNIANIIGPVEQLAVALAGLRLSNGKQIELKFDPVNAASTLKGLKESIKNIWADPDAIEAYKRLTGEALTDTAGAISQAAGDNARSARSILERAAAMMSESPRDQMSSAQLLQVNASIVGTAAGEAAAAEVAKVSSGATARAFEPQETQTIDVSSTWAALEEAQSATTLDDVYGFLENDAVTVTPYDDTNINYLGSINEYTKKTADNTSAIYDFMVSYLGPYLIIESMDEGNSLLQAAEGDQYKSLYETWLGSFGGGE